MTESVWFKYGKKSLCLTVAKGCDHLQIKEPEHAVDPARFKRDVHDLLPAGLCSGTKVAIVVADKTRLCGYDRFLPDLVDILEKKGVEPDAVTFYIAYGTHARQQEDESVTAYGSLYDRYRFIHHDCRDKNNFRYLGRTRYNTRVHMRKDLLDSDLIISFGALSHHYFAGYGGGRKLLFPGLGYIEDIYHNHSLFLNRTSKRLNPGCMPGNLEGNPLADDLEEIDTFNPVPRIQIHGILNSKGEVCRLITGTTYADFSAACRRLDAYYRIKSRRQYRTVVMSCGGYPKDINLIQAHKAINNAALFVKDGGNLMVMAQCPDGIGSETFLPYFTEKGFGHAFKRLGQAYEGNGGTALSMMSKTARINIFLKSDLDDRLCSAIGVVKSDLNRIQTLIDKTPQQDLACIYHAGLLIR